MSYKLQKALHKVNEQYFSFEQLPEIKVSKGQEKDNRRAIIFGTYNAQKNEIRIHPVLLTMDELALEFVVYHEMLHYEDRKALLKRKKGSRVHTAEFKQREKAFVGYDKAEKLLKSCFKNSKKKSELRGEALASALTDAVKRLEGLFVKYDLTDDKRKKEQVKKIEKTVGADNGA